MSGSANRARVCILNAGSSTLKYSIFDAGIVTSSATIKWNSKAQRSAQIDAALKHAGEYTAIGHRIVHGGHLFPDSAIVDGAVRSKLAELTVLDPLHMESALAVLDAAMKHFQDATHVVAFDTAFHSTLSEAAATYALPAQWTQQYGLRRFGFHGLSVAYAIDRLTEMLQRRPRRIIVCHLGSGCSMTAVVDGRSVDTTMGFTPLEGLMMGTRAGSVDPGLLMFLQLQHGLSAQEINTTLAGHSGLLGVSGISGDLREIDSAIAQGSKPAMLARSMFLWNARRAIGAMSGVLGGAEAVVFTGGIGEHDADIRAEVSAALGPGLIDRDRNSQARGDCVVSIEGGAIAITVIAAREDLMIYREVCRLS